MAEDQAVASPAGQAWAVPVPAGYRVGPWRVTGPIATGSWGSVYAARRAGPGPGGEDGDEVALKFLPVGRLAPRQQANLREVAEREVDRLARARHPRLVRALATHTVDDPAHPELHGAVVLVMERAERSLWDLLAATDPGTPVPGAGRLLTELCEALAAVHGNGWVHGDVKPGNVLLMADGSVRLADFGLSGELDGTHAYLPLLGSEDYLPPEWWTERVGPAGVAARPSRDIWSFGVLAHQLLSGGLHPFPGATPRARTAAAQAYALGRAELRLSDAVPAAWRPIVADCLAPSHARRRRHGAAQLLERIGGAAAGGDGRRGVGMRARALAVAGVLAVVAALGATQLPPGGDDPAPARWPAAARGFSGGELRADARVPARFRQPIVDAAHGCARPEVTPALIAAMLAAESNFDPGKRSPATDEYGIALWTPSVFEHWKVDADGGGASVLSAADSIAALGRFLCSVIDRNRHIPGDRALVLAAVYRVGGHNVRAVNGIPPQARDYVARVGRHLAEFTAPPAGG
jgi:eukaryotic-like serine/threonine-protein kinase